MILLSLILDSDCHSSTDCSPIGEQSVDEWQSESKIKLSKIINDPSELLLELLTATSYIMQLNDKNQLLSDRQVSNIRTRLNKNLGAIVLACNDILNKQLGIGG